MRTFYLYDVILEKEAISASVIMTSNRNYPFVHFFVELFHHLGFAYNEFCFWFVFFLNFLEYISTFRGATDTPVMDFWWRLPWVSKPRRIPHLLPRLAYNEFGYKEASFNFTKEISFLEKNVQKFGRNKYHFQSTIYSLQAESIAIAYYLRKSLSQSQTRCVCTSLYVLNTVRIYLSIVALMADSKRLQLYGIKEYKQRKKLQWLHREMYPQTVDILFAVFVEAMPKTLIWLRLISRYWW